MKIFQIIHWLTKLFKLNNKSKVILFILMPLGILAQNNAAFWLGKRPSSTPTNLLLDDYPGAAAAYSVRKLDKDYTGFAMEIRRASDNATQNIGFVGEDLDEVAINTFCSGTTCYVRTWYDQSGNGRDAAMTTDNTRQPLIYTAGSIVLDGTKPTIKFNGTSNVLLLPVFTGITANTSFFANVSFPDYALGSIFNYWNGSAGTDFLKINNVSYKKFSFTILTTININGHGTNSISLGRNLINVIGDSRINADIYINNTSITNEVSGPFGNSSLNSGAIGGRKDFNTFWNGNITEIIYYNSIETTNRTGITSNINSYYSIY